jgi:hypothetical protein
MTGQPIDQKLSETGDLGLEQVADQTIGVLTRCFSQILVSIRQVSATSAKCRHETRHETLDFGKTLLLQRRG